MSFKEFLQDSTKDTNHYICGIIIANSVLVILNLEFKVIYTCKDPHSEYGHLKKDVVLKLKELNIPIDAQFGYYSNIVELENDYKLKYNLICLSKDFKFPGSLKESVGQLIDAFELDDVIIKVNSAVLSNTTHIDDYLKNPVKFKGISNGRIYLQLISDDQIIAIPANIYKDGWEKYILPENLNIDNIKFL